MITVIQSKDPANVCKTLTLMPDGKIEKTSNAVIKRGVASVLKCDTPEELAAILKSVSARHDCALVLGSWIGSKVGDIIHVRTIDAATEFLGEEPGGMFEKNGKKYAVRDKDHMQYEALILIDGDNPPGMPAHMAAMTMQERLVALEKVIPGISRVTRVEMPSSSSLTSPYGPARHAYIRVKGNIALLKNEVLAGALEHDLCFLSPKKSRTTDEVIGHSVLTLIDLMVWQPNRLIFAAAPIGVGVEIYPARIEIVRGDKDVLDLTWLKQVKPERMVAGGERVGTKLKLDGSGNMHDDDSLTLDTMIEDADGVIKPLSQWLRFAKDGFKMRCQTPFRESYSCAAFLTRSGNKAMLHDSGTSTSYHCQLPLTKEQALDEIDDLRSTDSERAASIMKACRFLSALDKAVVMQAIKAKVKGATLGILRDVARHQPDDDEISESDFLAISRKFREDAEIDLIFVAGRFFKWDRGCWRLMEDPMVKKDIQNWLHGRKQDVSPMLVGAIFSTMANDVAVPASDLDQLKGDVVITPGGELHLNKDGWWELRPHDRKRYMTTCAPYDYEDWAAPPVFAQYMSTAFETDDERRAIMEMIGYMMVNSARFERFVMLIGSSGNGKSTLLALLQAITGAYCSVSPDKLKEPFFAVQLLGKFANIVPELSPKAYLSDGAVNSLASGDPLSMSFKGKDTFTGISTATQWYGMNRLPHSQDTSGATRSRALLIRMNGKFRGTPQGDTGMKDKLVAEAGAIMSQCLDVYAEAVRRGSLTTPKSVQDELDEWASTTDPVKDWAENCLSQDVGKNVGLQEAYDHFTRWAERAGVKHMQARRGFGIKLRDDYSLRVVRHGSGMVLSNLKLTGDPDFDIIEDSNVVPMKPKTPKG